MIPHSMPDASMGQFFQWLRTLVAVTLGWLASIASLAAADTASLAYTLPQAGRVSLAVYDGNGIFVRSILRADVRAAGTYVELWDGLDRNGKAMPIGTYTWKLLNTEGLKAEFICKLGNTRNPGWARCVGDWDSSLVVACDSIGVYLLGGSESPESAFAKNGWDDKSIWHRSGHGWPRSVTVVSGDIFILDAESGIISIWEGSTGEHEQGGGAWSASKPILADGKVIDWEPAPEFMQSRPAVQSTDGFSGTIHKVTPIDPFDEGAWSQMAGCIFLADDGSGPPAFSYFISGADCAGSGGLQFYCAGAFEIGDVQASDMKSP